MHSDNDSSTQRFEFWVSMVPPYIIWIHINMYMYIYIYIDMIPALHIYIYIHIRIRIIRHIMPWLCGMNRSPCTQRHMWVQAVLNLQKWHNWCRESCTERPTCFVQIVSTDSTFLQSYRVNGWDVYSQQYRGLFHMQWYAMIYYGGAYSHIVLPT